MTTYPRDTWHFDAIVARDVGPQRLPVKLFDVLSDVVYPHIAGDFLPNYTIFAFLSLVDAYRTKQPAIFRFHLLPGKPGEELAWNSIKIQINNLFTCQYCKNKSITRGSDNKPNIPVLGSWEHRGKLRHPMIPKFIVKHMLCIKRTI